MSQRELDRFLETWNFESAQTVRLLEALPAHQYDFRAHPGGRSLGELAWHLAELEAFMSHGIEQGRFDASLRPPGIERPRQVAELVTGYRRVHEEAVARVRRLRPEDLDQAVPFFGGRALPVRQVLWSAVLHHLIHHRGQLALMCRIAGGTPPGLYGPTREEMEAMRTKQG